MKVSKTYLKTLIKEEISRVNRQQKLLEAIEEEMQVDEGFLDKIKNIGGRIAGKDWAKRGFSSAEEAEYADKEAKNLERKAKAKRARDAEAMSSGAESLYKRSSGGGSSYSGGGDQDYEYRYQGGSDRPTKYYGSFDPRNEPTSAMEDPTGTRVPSRSDYGN